MDSETVFQGHFSVLRDRLRKPDGGEMTYTYIESRNAAAVLAFTKEGQVVLTRQYRHPIRETIYDLPAGGVKRGESSEQAARRELREETGYRAGELRLLGVFYPSPGTLSSRVDVYLAAEVEPGESAPDPNEIIEVVLLDWGEVLDLVRGSDPVDVTLAYAVMRYGLMK